MEIDIREAKTAPRLVEGAPAGEEVVIGTAEGQIIFHPGWDAPLTDPELEEIFQG